ncbi:MAG: transcription-repair coupling factor, partial [Oscillospiraceae bacterium]|nr:transcription-repair coupling factor [Oscillospiraceae bacterium]
MRFFTEAAEQLPAVRELRRALEKGVTPVSVTGVAQIHRAQILLTLSQDAPVLAVVADEAAARQLCEDINFMAGARAAYPYPAKELNFLDAAGISREYEQLRLTALSAVCSGQCRVLAASAEAAMQFTLPQDVLVQRMLHLAVGDTFEQKALAEKLTALGYVRTEQVDAPCQFSVRGAIFDIFSSQNPLPVRLEFWGDEIDSMAWFEPETQRRTDTVDTADIAPAVEALPDPAALAESIRSLAKQIRSKHAAELKEKLRADAEKLESGVPLLNIDMYFPLIYEQPATLFDYCAGGVFLCETSALFDAWQGLQARYLEDVKLMLEDGTLCRQLADYYMDANTVLSRAKERPLVCMNAFLSSTSSFQFQKMLSVEATQNAPWGGSTRILTEDLAELCRRGYRVLVCGGTEKTLPILLQDLQQSG